MIDSLFVYKQRIKTGRPRTPEIILTGSSAAETRRLMISTIKRKMPPMKNVVGTTWVLFVPIVIRANCGITSPIHPIEPEIDTSAATMKVADRIKRIRKAEMLTPNVLASLSEKLKMFSLHLNKKTMAKETPMGKETEPS